MMPMAEPSDDGDFFADLGTEPPQELAHVQSAVAKGEDQIRRLHLTLTQGLLRDGAAGGKGVPIASAANPDPDALVHERFPSPGLRSHPFGFPRLAPRYPDLFLSAIL